MHGACRTEALIYTSKCDVKDMTIGISAPKHTLQHSRLLSKKKNPLICKIIGIEAAEGKADFPLSSSALEEEYSLALQCDYSPFTKTFSCISDLHFGTVTRKK